MRILRVFPRRTSHTPTDDLAFVGDPPLFRPEADRVDVSCVFSWDVAEARRLAETWAQYYPLVALGGPAIAPYPGDAFTPGLYIKAGFTFTSRGCDRNCPWCLVPKREGPIRLLPIQDGWIINDNNFAQTPKAHRQAVYQMLRRQQHAAVFAGGVDARLVTDELADEFRSIRIGDVFLAADTAKALGPLEQAVARLAFLGREKTRCYVLCGYNDEIVEQAEARLRRVWEIGAMPFAQLWQPDGPKRLIYSPEWRRLQRTWSRPAAMKAEMAGRVT